MRSDKKQGKGLGGSWRLAVSRVRKTAAAAEAGPNANNTCSRRIKQGGAGAS